MITHAEIRHAHMFCGLGGGARGFNRGEARVGSLRAQFRCLGGIDNDPAAIRDFERLSGVSGTVLDLFSREQYRAFHGTEPPADWREAMPTDIHRAFGFERPHILFLSAPCKGFSGLLSEGKSKSAKYQALNGLTLRGIWLALEAYRDDPPELLVFENVPRIATRGRRLLDEIVALLRSFGYAVAETTHDCGHLGGLAQSRKRFLLVARHAAKVPSFLYEPVRRPLRAVGDVLGRMPMPGDPAAGPMHRIPNLQWKTWVRLAFVEAGSDWRSLNKLAVEDGFLRDYGIVPERVWQDGALGVLPWGGPSGVITGKAQPTTGRFAVADPRRPGEGFGKYAVTDYDGSSGTVIAGSTTGQGAFAVADPRPDWMLQTRRDAEAYENIYRIVAYEDHCKAVTGAAHTAGGALSVADPRPGMCGDTGADYLTAGHYGVRPWDAPSGTVSAAACHDNGFFSVADPRCHGWGREHNGHSREGHYGVLRYDENARTIGAHSSYDNSFCAVADPRLPEPSQNCVAVIRALDGTWHRPFTTLELAALQALIDPEEHLELDGLSDQAWRERIGNAVPPPAAQAVAGVMGEVLLLTWSGQTFSMGSTPIWVRPMVAGLMAARGGI